MNDKRIITPPIRQEFEKYGDRFTQIAYNPQTEMYLYKRELSSGVIYWEVFKRTKNATHGYDIYPSTGMFGFGRALCIRGNEENKAVWYLNNGFSKGRYKESAETSQITERVSDRDTFTPLVEQVPTTKENKCLKRILRN